ncbi:MAG: segregation/condensation protein A [Verrucomicrobia bacterium]|nr:segregation/condensation protein A [Verrucomicrobiota bacterium]
MVSLSPRCAAAEFPLAAPPAPPTIHRNVVPDADYRIKLQVFEGPLDLLLFLIRKNELDIYDIPIESVTRQYLEALRAMQQLDLDLAGEFFVMAATLMEIKSRMLLPRGLAAVDPNAEEDGLDPRWELVHQLLQYKKFKEAAAKLNELAVERQNLMERYVSALNDHSDRPLKGVNRIELWNVFNIVLRRLAEKLVVGEIHDEVVTVADQMEWLLTRVQTEKSFVFSHLFPEGVTLRRLVATFLAVLELTRLKKLRLRQNEAFSDIHCDAVDENPLETAVAAGTVTA